MTVPKRANERVVTLDLARERYAANPSRRNSDVYLRTAFSYWADGMIEDSTLLSHLNTISSRGGR